MGIEKNQLDHVLISGDSYADLKSGVRGIVDTVDQDEVDPNPIATYVIPRKSRLTNVLNRLEVGAAKIQDDKESEESIEQEPAGLQVSAYPLTPEDPVESGHYSYQPERHIPDLQVVKASILKEKGTLSEKGANLLTSASEKIKQVKEYRKTEVIIGDEAYAEATSPPDSLLQYLHEKYPDNP